MATPDIQIDPVKNVPTAIIDASGALQLDDGSLSGITMLPRRLVKRKKGPVNFRSLRKQLVSGFDSGIGATILLMSLFGVWYYANTAFNVYNKQVLKVFPFPLTCTAVQFFVATICMASMWLFRVKAPPKVNSIMLRASLPLALLHAAGFVLTNMSLGKVSVAFTHTVKSTEPFFSVALTPSILGDVPTWGILVSLLPIVGGVGLASLTEASFNWIGFFSAMGSNLAMQGRNVLSKKLMDSGTGNGRRRRGERELTEAEKETFASLDNINLFSTMSMLAFVVLLPLSGIFEGAALLAQGNAAALSSGISGFKLVQWLFLGGFYRCVDVLSSYMILRRVSAVTHAVGNCVKRAVVIVTSIFFFRTPMTTLNIVGTVLALLGVMVYSLIVSACKQNHFGPDSPFCKPIYETEEMELTEGSGI